ncbi:MAG: GNAT family N-acetyltransferase [Candidatus Kapabacteria bacterium]|nr:GNAT family N-acetyltransferase [Candidatus Kapabacteria bacterium]
MSNMKDSVNYRFAHQSEAGMIKNFLSVNNMHINDIDENIGNFILAEIDNKLIGTIGLEVYGDYGLVRSLAVDEQFRNNGIARELYFKILALSLQHGIKQLYLFTLSAEIFFAKLGFEKVDRNSVPFVMDKYLDLCHETATCMSKFIFNEAMLITKDIMQLKTNFRGYSMWSVSLDRTTLTYYDIGPNCYFDWHNHKSEQITHILEGELYFELGNRTICVKKGEVIAIPSNVFHAAFTKDSAVKAIDAWSPVMIR